LTEILEATASVEAFHKYNPDWQNQPRVPAGQPHGGQWTDGDGGGGDAGGGPKPEDEIDDPPLEPVYPELLILPFLRTGRLIAALRRLIESGRRGADWKFGSYKSPKRWANQLEERKWTPDEISQVIKNGKKFPAPNKVNPGNKAVRY